MATPLARLKEIAGVAKPCRRQLYLFVAGDHGVGKSFLVSRFQDDQNRIKPSAATFGYEYTVAIINDSAELHIIEVTDASSDNIVLSELISKHIDQSCFLILSDMKHPGKISDSIEKYLRPLLSTVLKPYLGSPSAKSLPEYYSSVGFLKPTALGEGSLTTNTVIPFVFVGSFDDSMGEFDDRKFDSYVSALRKKALEFGAGVSLSHSESLLPLVVALSSRSQLQPEMLSRICKREDFFLPPGWDSLEKVKSLPADIDFSEALTTVAEPELKVAVPWPEFLQSLASEPQVSTPVPMSKSNPSSLKSPPSEHDFFTQFEARDGTATPK